MLISSFPSSDLIVNYTMQKAIKATRFENFSNDLSLIYKNAARILWPMMPRGQYSFIHPILSFKIKKANGLSSRNPLNLLQLIL